MSSGSRALRWARRLALAAGTFFYDFDVAVAGFVVGDAGLGVFLGGDFEVGFDAGLVLGVEVFEEGDAPLAAGAGAEAFADEGGDGGIFGFEVGADLPQGDAEAEADVVVGVHDSC
jgi:hypothetical protein